MKICLGLYPAHKYDRKKNLKKRKIEANLEEQED